MSAEMGVPISGLHVSSIYNKFMYKSKLHRDEIENARKRNPHNYKFSEVYETGRADLAINQAVENGWLCTERGLPFDKIKPSQILDMVKALENLKPSIIMNQMESNSVCLEISSILSPFSLMASEINEIAESIVKDNLNVTMSIFAERACTEQIRQVPKIDIRIVRKANDLKNFMNELNFNISKGRLQTVDYDLEAITNYRGVHSSIIVGRRWNNGRCEYNIRNSWGKSCGSYKTGIECNKEQGTFWVRDEDLFKASYNIRYISN